MQDGELCSPCGPGIIAKFRRQLVLYIAAAGLIKNIFKCEVTMMHWETGAILPKL